MKGYIVDATEVSTTKENILVGKCTDTCNKDISCFYMEHTSTTTYIADVDSFITKHE